MYSNNKFRGFLSAAMAFSLFVTGCSMKDYKNTSDSSSVSGDNENTTESSDISVEKLSSDSTAVNDRISSIFSDRDLDPEYDAESAVISLNGDSAEVNGSGAVYDNSVITITDEGIYLISGTLDDGRIIVDSGGKVQLVLDNANITCSDSAPIYVKNANKVFVTLAENSENTLTDGFSYNYANETDNEPDAVIFSSDSLTINGSGTLNVIANYNEGITGKDDIVITGGIINIESPGNGIKGKDYVAICNAKLNIESGADGIKSTNTEEDGLGFVYAESGVISINSVEDGIQAETEFIAENGEFNITSGGGSQAAEPKNNNDFGGGMGGRDFFEQNNSETSATEDESSVSTKGIKGGTAITISGGTFNINSADDSLHSNADIAIYDGDITLSTGDKGIHGDGQLVISGGSIRITESYEGIEAAVINVTGGTVEIKSSDDGFNASDGTSQGAMGTYSDGVQLNISGGMVYVDADGDGLDSNGDMTISGGTVLVNGPTNGGNGALDGNNDITLSGGLLIAAGSSEMAEYPGNSSSQYSVSATLDEYQEADTLVTLCDDGGNELVSFAPAKTFNHIVISSPDIKSGENYTLYIGGTSSAEEKYGLYTIGGYDGKGTESGSFTANDMTSFIGSQSMMGGGFGGGHGGDRDNFGGQGKFEMPTNENGETEMPDGDFGGKDGFGGKGEFEMPTDENGNPEMPENGFGGGFPGGGDMKEPPADENGRPEMPQGDLSLPYSDSSV